MIKGNILKYKSFAFYTWEISYFLQDIGPLLCIKTISWLATYATQKEQERFGIFSPIKNVCFERVCRFLPSLVSKLYLDYANFDTNARTDVENMVELIKTSFHQLLEANNWMDAVTKKLAKEKLTAIHANVAASDIVFDGKSLEQDSAEVSC